jgi:hypothetical protein
MQIYFAGVESPAHLTLLKQCGVEHVAVNVNNLARFTSHYASWASRDRLGGLDWVCYADTPHCPSGPVLELLAGSEVTAEAVLGPVSWAENTWLADSDLGFFPFWDGHDSSILRTYSEDYEGIALTDAVVDNPVAVRTARAALPTMGQLFGLTGRSKSVERFDTVVSSAWWAVQKHGETQVWVNNRLVRLNSDDKHQKRRRYADAIEALGCDVSAVLADDPTETVRCAVLSWLQMEKHVNSLLHRGGGGVASGGSSPNLPAVTPLRPVASGRPSTGHQSAPVAQTASNLVTLPALVDQVTVTESEDSAGNKTTTEHHAIAVTAESARQCSTCQLSAACPGFSPGSACAYQIPVVISTKEQRRAVMQALVEIQTQRILMGNFSEQVLGTPDPQVGKEMDRLFSMVEKWKNIEDTSSKLRISVDSQGETTAAAGVISRLFGNEAAVNAKLLDRPILTDELIEEAEMVE